LDCTCPDPEEEDDGTCDDVEPHATYDCMTPSEFCEDDEDCPDFGTIEALCVENQCMAEDYDSWAPTCNPWSPLYSGPCLNGWKCKWSFDLGGIFVCVDPLATR
jgi:hypothetical protein